MFVTELMGKTKNIQYDNFSLFRAYFIDKAFKLFFQVVALLEFAPHANRVDHSAVGFDRRVGNDQFFERRIATHDAVRVSLAHDSRGGGFGTSGGRIGTVGDRLGGGFGTSFGVGDFVGHSRCGTGKLVSHNWCGRYRASGKGVDHCSLDNLCKQGNIKVNGKL